MDHRAEPLKSGSRTAAELILDDDEMVLIREDVGVDVEATYALGVSYGTDWG